MVAPSVDALPSTWTEQNIRLKGSPFSFKGREYLKAVYDSPYPKRFIRAGRQVEKTVLADSRILMANGSWKHARDVEIGDLVATLATGSMEMTIRPVTWKSHYYTKPCRRVRTFLGHEAVMAHTHPVRMWNSWVETGRLKIGDRIASVRKGGSFGTFEVDHPRIGITAYLIGDGYIKRDISFTSMPGPTLDEFKRLVESCGDTYRINRKSQTEALAVGVHRNGMIAKWLKEDGLFGCLSADKFVPSWVHNLGRADCALFLNRLWSTDGHVKKNGHSKYSIEYASISRRLVLDVQALLWKFGIPSKIRTNWPNIYKKRGEQKFAYILRILTSHGVHTFLSQIGALGKSEGVSLPNAFENNNRDTLPIEIGELIREIRDSVPVRHGGPSVTTLHSNDLRLTLKYPLTYDKAALYVSYFKSDPAYDQEKVAHLEVLLSKDVYWDRVAGIEEVGDQECVDFEVDETHNFVTDGLITHNSSTLANIQIQETFCTPYTNALYVSASQAQTSVYSTGYVKSVLMDSPSLCGSWYRPGSSMYVDKIYEKQFTNQSRMYFRYAFLTADRARGIGASRLLLDELQDQVSKNIPILEECTSHYMSNRKWVYSGTPKTYENAMETYWKRTTQKEWVVQCKACNHWNILGEANVQQKGLSCEKCKKLIDARTGQWARFGSKDAEFDGFRISQLMVSWAVWKEIWIKYKNYPKQQFYNEVLGLSCEKSSSLLTQADILRACSSVGFPMYTTRPADRYYQSLHGGVDWGAGQGSMTVHAIGGLYDGIYELIYMKKYDPSKMETDEIVKDIARVNFQFKIMTCGVDWGFGFMQNQELQKHHRTIMVLRFYSSGTQKAMCVYNKKDGNFVINRNAVIADLFGAIKRGRVRFFRYMDFEQFAKDFLCVFQDLHSQNRTLFYNHPGDIPDDAVHATNYSRTCALLFSRQLVPGRPEFHGN